MASPTSYADLSPDDQRECNHWNFSLAANPNSPLHLAHSNPPQDHQLFTTGYSTYEELKAAPDEYSFKAGWKSCIGSSGATYKRLNCTKGPKRQSVASKKESFIIKSDCK